MPETPTIQTKAEHAEAMERLRSAMCDDSLSDDEVEEFRALAQAIMEYEQQHCELWQIESDGVHELQFMLDQEITTFDELVPVIGGWDVLIDYMTRQRDLDDATIDRMVTNLDTKREWLAKPFCLPPGWAELETYDDTSWGRELLARRGTKAAREREPELAATA